MAKKKKEEENKHKDNPNVMGLHAEIVEQPITETLEINFMPYAMSVIMSRAIPEIDGFKPSHRKLLYTMYKMGLLTGSRTKSANIVGQTMRLNPHGDSAIYETMVRLSRGYGALLHPFVDSKGNFGKAYSRDMAYAACRLCASRLRWAGDLWGNLPEPHSCPETCHDQSALPADRAARAGHILPRRIAGRRFHVSPAGIRGHHPSPCRRGRRLSAGGGSGRPFSLNQSQGSMGT